MEPEPERPRPFNPDSLEDREALAESAYTRACELTATRRSEHRGEEETYYFCAWDQLDPEQQEPYRSAVEALVSVIRID